MQAYVVRPILIALLALIVAGLWQSGGTIALGYGSACRGSILSNRNVDQPYKYVGTWLIDEWSKIGLHATQRVVPTGPWFEAMRGGTFDVVLEANCEGVVNPLMDTQKYLPRSVYTENYGMYDDQTEIDLYQKMLHEPDAAKQRVLMREFEKRVVDTEAHEFPMLWWYRIIPYRSYVKGWKISPSHYLNQDLSTVWLDK